MSARLGVVAPKQSLAVFEAAAASLANADPVWLSYDTEPEIASVVAAGVSHCDALCFSGGVPRERTSDLPLPPGMPTTVVQLTTVDIALCLLRAERSRGTF